jgi:hypothetical protein
MKIDPDGIDLGWFAADGDGHLAFFTSGGSRVVPELVLKSKEALDRLEYLVSELPAIGDAIVSKNITGKLDDWVDMARRGLFGFDFSSFDDAVFENGEYILVAKPSQPLNLADVDSFLKDALQTLAYKTVCFSTLKVLSKAVICELR